MAAHLKADTNLNREVENLAAKAVTKANTTEEKKNKVALVVEAKEVMAASSQANMEDNNNKVVMEANRAPEDLEVEAMNLVVKAVITR